MHRTRTLRTTTRSSTVPLSPADAWAVVASGETAPAWGSQWYVDAAPFVFRGGLDRLVGGAGRAFPPPGRALLEPGDRAGFWEVLDADHDAHRLLLEAKVRAPGVVRCETTAAAGPTGTGVTMTISLAPRGPVGVAYLLADLPARAVVSELTMLHLLTALRRSPQTHDNRSWRPHVDEV